MKPRPTSVHILDVTGLSIGMTCSKDTSNDSEFPFCTVMYS